MTSAAAIPGDLSLGIDPATGLLRAVTQVLSPHCDERPAGITPELLVIHGISLPPGEFGGPWIDRLFTGNLPVDVHPYFREIAPTRVSAHALIRRDGSMVQYVPFGQRAWHAGVSSWRGRTACNDFSIGVELEGADGVPYMQPQYMQLAALTRALFESYPVLKEEGRIVGHGDIAPERRSDPWGSFDWKRYRSLIG